MLIRSSAVVSKITVCHNRTISKGGGIDVQLQSSMLLSNVNYFINNSVNVVAGGALSIFQSIVHLTGDNYFINNSADMGGAVAINLFSHLNVDGYLIATNNQARLGGGLVNLVLSSVEFQQGAQSLFDKNLAEQGGAIFMLDSSLLISGIHKYTHNSATQGGVMSLLGKSKLRLIPSLDAMFISNAAQHVGGALYFDDPISTTQCNKTFINKYITTNTCPDPTSPGEYTKCSTNQECFFEIEAQIPSRRFLPNITLTFVNNSAELTGAVLYGGMLDECRVYIGGAVTNDCGVRGGGEYNEDPISVFKSISVIDNETSSISSAPLRVCLCKDGMHDCNLKLSLNIVTGKQFVISAVAVGQGDFAVPSDIRVDLDSNIYLDPSESIQHTGIACTDIRYRLYSAKDSITFTIYPDGPCRDIGIARHEIQLTFLPCPDGFSISGIECICESRLQRYSTKCNVEDNSISRTHNTYWIEGHRINDTYKGLIIHPAGCPFDYCVNVPVNVTLEDPDIQCDFNHSGTLCGSCKQNFSVTLGTLHCSKCTNAHLTLVLPFAVAGILLILLLHTLRMTVARGTINSLIFYANTVQINSHIFFPQRKSNILTVFIAWLNLDLGIETCFYDGMDVYVYTWLQYLFPFYVWFLIAIIIIVSHHSHTVSKLLGSNPVAVLSILILLSYTKVLRTIIWTLSYTVLEYENNTLQHVWLYDGEILYFQSPRHIVLGIFALLVLIFLFMPYTILMLISHKLYAHSNKRIFSWMNRIMPFLDAYHAPYNKQHRYWTGLLLLIRCAMFLTFALNTLGSASVNLIAITSVSAGLLVITWIQGKIYLNTYNDILEASFLLNLCIFSAATYHVNETGGNQAGLAYVSVGIALVTFICISSSHIYNKLKDTTFWKTLCAKFSKLINCIHHKKTLVSQDGKAEENQVQIKHTPTVSVIEIDIDQVSQYTA